MNVCDFVFDKIKQYGDEIALIDFSTNKTIKFSEIQPKAEAIAADLSWWKGVNKGDVVSIIATNEPKYVIIVYALIRLGAIVNSISPLSNQETMVQQLKDSNTKLILSNLFTHLQFFDNVVHFNDLIESDIKKLPDVKISNEDELLILWTSGTTGKPKGIVHTHKSMLAQYEMAIEDKHNKIKDYMGQRHKDIVAGTMPLSKGMGLYVYAFGAMLQGACVVTLPKFDTEEYIKLILKYKVTVVHAVPIMIDFLIKHPLIETITSLREIISGGSSVPHNLISEIKKQEFKLRQCYGMEETACISSPQYEETRSYSVGKICSGIEFKIIDETDELCIRGPNVMKRWLNDSKSCVDEDGFYHTGDVVTFEKDDTMIIVGRLEGKNTKTTRGTWKN